MKEAFTYMFRDTMFGKKAFTFCFIYFCVLLIAGADAVFKTPVATQSPSIVTTSNPFLYLLFPIGLLLYAVLEGYSFAAIKAIAEQKNNIVLPFINLYRNFVKGIKFGIAFLLPYIALFLIVYLSSFFLTVYRTFIILAIILVLTCFIFYFIYSNAFYILFANEGRILTFFRWKKVCNILKSANKKIYFRNLFLIIFVNILGGLLSLLFNYIFNVIIRNNYAAWIITSAEGALIAGYTSFIIMYLVAKSIEPKTVV